MGGLGAQRFRAEGRSEPQRLADLLQRISSELIRSPHFRLPDAIARALAGLGEALDAERALVVPRSAGRVVQHHSWERGRPNGASRPAVNDGVDSIVATLELERTVACGSRKHFPLPRGARSDLPHALASGIFAPVRSNGQVDGVLAVFARTSRSWAADCVEAAERVAAMLSAGLHRMATQSTLTHEQEARVLAEAETRRLRDQLAHAGRVSMLGELAASLAHELNQPLTAIYTNAQAAHRFLDRSRPDLSEALNALHDLGQDCRRAGDVLGRLRQMFRRHETERVPLGAGVLVEHVLMLLHEDAVARGVEIKLDVEPDLPLVRGDRVQLEQVLMNLLVNAFEAVAGIPSGPKQVTVRAYARDGFVEVAVLDSGKGIARNALERIFEPFFTRKPNGMGMGLAICRTIVEAHGGRISADNRSERGAVFELSLPALPAADQSEGVES